MGETLIEYVDQVANVIKTVDGGYHCTKVSAGCDHCWAEAFNRRFGNGRPYDAAPAEFVLDERPFERLALARKPKLVFLQSMSDLAHPDVPYTLLYRTFDWIRLLRKHTFLILTKRLDRLLEFMLRLGKQEPYNVWPLPNVWVGISVEDQPTFDERWAYLSRIRAAVRFVSYEPALSPIDTAQVFGLYEWEDGKWALKVDSRWAASPDWIIVGGETGPGARPMHPDSPRLLRDQCRAANVPFYFKSWGEWHESDLQPNAGGFKTHLWPDGKLMYRVGKKLAGRLLDGVEHSEFPDLPTTIPK